MTEAALFSPDLIRRYDRQGPRYTSYPSADRFENDFSLVRAEAALVARDASRPLSLYFHVPFCQTLCLYCGCHRIPTRRLARGTRYVDFLIDEMELVARHLQGARVATQLHLGGGTPTFLDNHDLERLMLAARRAFSLAPDAQCSIEVDPRSVDESRIVHLASLGFNRLSLGVQDFDSEVQKAINRIQTEAQTLQVLQAARRHGFRSISVDLIYGLPFQTPARFAVTLQKVIAQRPDRIALYNYAHLPERFPAQARMPAAALPSAEQKLTLLGASIATLAAAGYSYIGMDHFALHSDELAQARQNGTLQRNFQGYSTHAECELLGFGVSAIGSVGGSFLQNAKNLDVWESAIASGRLPVARGYTLTEDDVVRSELIQALMCQQVVNLTRLGRRFGIDFWTYFADAQPYLQALADDGLVRLGRDTIEVLPPGRLLIRHVAMAFDGHLAQANAARYSKVI